MNEKDYICISDIAKANIIQILNPSNSTDLEKCSNLNILENVNNNLIKISIETIKKSKALSELEKMK